VRGRVVSISLKYLRLRTRSILSVVLLLSEIARDGAGGGLKERRDALEKTYQQILDKNPEHLPTLNEYALLLSVSRGEHDAAEELYLCALDINPFHKRTVSLCALAPSAAMVAGCVALTRCLPLAWWCAAVRLRLLP
jgi:tetratricopeptide (TPR) repeat protein